MWISTFFLTLHENQKKIPFRIQSYQFKYSMATLKVLCTCMLNFLTLPGHIPDKLTLSAGRFPPPYTSPCSSSGRTSWSLYGTRKKGAASNLWLQSGKNSCVHPLTFQKWFLLDLQCYVPARKKNNSLKSKLTKSMQE